MMNQTLDSIVKVDEWVLLRSHSKSGFYIPRAPHRPGDRVCTHLWRVQRASAQPLRIEQGDLALAEAAKLGRVTTKSIEAAFDNMLSDGATPVTDKHNAYVRYADESNHELVRPNGKEPYKESTARGERTPTMARSRGS